MCINVVVIYNQKLEQCSFRFNRTRVKIGHWNLCSASFLSELRCTNTLTHRCSLVGKCTKHKKIQEFASCNA